MALLQMPGFALLARVIPPTVPSQHAANPGTESKSLSCPANNFGPGARGAEFEQGVRKVPAIADAPAGQFVPESSKRCSLF
jgi:hypothetical protein